jgi:hypothetical protein
VCLANHIDEVVEGPQLGRGEASGGNLAADARIGSGVSGHAVKLSKETRTVPVADNQNADRTSLLMLRE